MIYVCGFDPVGKWSLCFFVNLGKSQWFTNHFEKILVIQELFWNYSGANLSDLRTILKWFYRKYWWILEICELLWTDSGGESWWCINHSGMILGRISVIHKPFGNEFRVNLGDSQQILVIPELFWNDCGVNLQSIQ